MIFDCHIHTKHFSTDAKMTIDECLNALNHNNISGIITEHIDYDYPDPAQFVFDPNEYFTEFVKYRSTSLKLGVEVGMQDVALSKNKALIQNNPFDMVIAATHMVHGTDIYYPEFYYDKSKETSYSEYFDAMLNGINKLGDFDTLAHLDYISRYSPYDDPYIHYSEYHRYIDEILNYIINTGKALEINTRLFDDDKAVNTIDKIMSVYSKMGGKYITFGSDAHIASNIGMNFKKACHIAQQYNLRPVYFENRNMQYA